MFCCTVTQIQIDQALVRDTYLFGDRLEVVDSITVQADGDLLLEQIHILRDFADAAERCRLERILRPCKSTDHPYNVQMIKFDWDPAKAASNLRKHGVSFEEAQSVFYDELAVQFYDEPHSSDEERFLMLGMSSGAHLLLVCHCERDSGGVIRIISARKATKKESSFYSQ